MNYLMHNLCPLRNLSTLKLGHKFSVSRQLHKARPCQSQLLCLYNSRLNYLTTYEQACLLHTATVHNAGHSKWANIKHTKQSKDNEKSFIFSRYVKQIKFAAKEPGGIDASINTKLARIIEQAKKQNMPTSTIENALKRLQKAEDNAKPGVISLVGPGGLFILVDVVTDKITRTTQEINSIVKKSKVLLKHEKGGQVEASFEEKGVIVTTGQENGLPQALDHAIEVGAEDVVFEDGAFTFTCSQYDFTVMKKGLEALNYDIQYADVDKIPNIIATVRETDVEALKATLSKLEEHEDVSRVHTNFEL